MLGYPPTPPRGARRLTARPADPQGLGQPRCPPPPLQPLRYMARKPALCITALMNEMPEPLSLNRRLGLRPPHGSHNLSRHTGSIDRIQGGSRLGLVHVSTLRHEHEVWPIGYQQLPQDHMKCRGAHTPCV